jgi:mono/diheme cytochrome c family protein
MARLLSVTDNLGRPATDSLDLHQDAKRCFMAGLIQARKPGMRAALIGSMAMLALALAAARGDAQEIGQPARGLALAQRLCTQCHAVEKEQPQSPNENAPRFQVIASVPGMTSIALSAALNTSHQSMPNIMLTPDERANIIAYILSLK